MFKHLTTREERNLFAQVASGVNAHCKWNFTMEEMFVEL